MSAYMIWMSDISCSWRYREIVSSSILRHAIIQKPHADIWMIRMWSRRSSRERGLAFGEALSAMIDMHGPMAEDRLMCATSTAFQEPGLLMEAAAMPDLVLVASFCGEGLDESVASVLGQHCMCMNLHRVRRLRCLGRSLQRCRHPDSNK